MQDAQRPREITGKACLFQQSIGQIRKKARLMKFGLEISAGTIGQVLLAVFSILINMLGYLYFNFMDFVWLGFLASIAFLFGSSLILVSTIDNYDDFVSVAPGTIGAIFGVISAAMLIVQFGMAPLGISYAPGYTYRYFSEYFYYPTRFGIDALCDWGVLRHAARTPHAPRPLGCHWSSIPCCGTVRIIYLSKFCNILFVGPCWHNGSAVFCHRQT
jgi:hypothetical protein